MKVAAKTGSALPAKKDVVVHDFRGVLTRKPDEAVSPEAVQALKVPHCSPLPLPIPPSLHPSLSSM